MADFPLDEKEVEALARRLCKAAKNHDPDCLVYRDNPYMILTPEGQVACYQNSPSPLWYFYRGMAINWMLAEPADNDDPERRERNATAALWRGASDYARQKLGYENTDATPQD